MARRTHTLYIDEDIWTKFRYLVPFREKRSASDKIESFMRTYINECEGKAEDDLASSTTADYEDAKNLHNKVVRELDKIEKRLRQRRVYDELKDFSQKIGLNLETLNSLTNLAPELIQKWAGVKEDAHQWISLLELVKKKWEVEARLEEIRIKQASSVGSNPTKKAVPSEL